MSSVGPATVKDAATPVPETSATSALTPAQRVLTMLRSHKWQVLLLLTIVIIAVTAGPRIVLGPQVPVELVARQTLVQSLVASGRVESPHRVEVGVQMTGRVARAPVTEGQVVTAGTTLLELESSELRAALGQAESALAAARARARQVREVQAPNTSQGVRQARLAHDAARDARVRNDALLRGGAIGEAAHEVSVRAEQTALAQLRVAEQQAASAAPSGSDAAAATAGVAQADAAVRLARAKLSYASVRAVKSGTVIMREVEPGDVVQPGRTLLVLAPEGDTHLIVQIDEKNLRLLRVGLTALASADAYPKKRFAATVLHITPGVDALRGAVKVTLLVPAPPAYLMEDMTASVDIEITRRDSAILVPATALHDEGSTAPWVYRIDGGRARRRAVTLGLCTAGLCEVVTGLVPGDRVIPLSDASIEEGDRVRGTLPVVKQ